MRLGVIFLLIVNCCACAVAVVPSAVHVDAVNGSDLNNGVTRHLAVATIQQGIDLALDGDTVLVWPGRYAGPVNFGGKSITVMSAADAAVIDGQDDFAVLFYNGEGHDSVLKNFVIENSMTAISIIDGSPTLEQLTVVKNYFGIHVSAGNEPVIRNSIFWGNEMYDLQGAESQFSCVEDAMADQEQREGPRFADYENGDYHLRSEAGRFEPFMPGSYEWVEVRTYTELNDGEHTPYTPMLSEDGLKMYFSRFIPELGHICIVEAYRDTPGGEFTSERVLTELFEYNNNVSGPWISNDGRRLYYQAKMNDGIARIHMAQLNEQTGLWEKVKVFGEINDGEHGDALPSLTADERMMVWQSVRPGKQLQCFIATRSNRNEPFSNVRPLHEINTDEINARPLIMDKGLTLYFLSEEIVQGETLRYYYRVVRSDIDQLFDSMTRLELPINPDTDVVYHNSQFVTEDESRALLKTEFGINEYRFKDGQWVLDEVTSPCIDAGDPTVNPMAEPMPNGALANVGAYGVTPYASRSIHPWPNPYDFNHSGKVDFADYVKFAESWLWQMPWAD